jgi:hypothetical protein
VTASPRQACRTTAKARAAPALRGADGRAATRKADSSSAASQATMRSLARDRSFADALLTGRKTFVTRFGECRTVDYHAPRCRPSGGRGPASLAGSFTHGVLAHAGGATAFSDRAGSPISGREPQPGGPALLHCIWPAGPASPRGCGSPHATSTGSVGSGTRSLHAGVVRGVHRRRGRWNPGAATRNDDLARPPAPRRRWPGSASSPTTPTRASKAWSASCSMRSATVRTRRRSPPRPPRSRPSAAEPGSSAWRTWPTWPTPSRTSWPAAARGP